MYILKTIIEILIAFDFLLEGLNFKIKMQIKLKILQWKFTVFIIYRYVITTYQNIFYNIYLDNFLYTKIKKKLFPFLN